MSTEQPSQAYTSVAAASTSDETVLADKPLSLTSRSDVETPHIHTHIFVYYTE